MNFRTKDLAEGAIFLPLTLIPYIFTQPYTRSSVLPNI